jgi:hypothetical protein
VVAPQMPTGHAIGEAVLHHEAHGRLLDPMGVVGLGWGQVGLVRGEAAPTGRAAMRGVADMEVDRPAAPWVTEIVKGPGGHTPPARTTTTEGAAPTGVVTAATLGAWLGKILDPGDPFGDIGHIDAWSTHGSHLLTLVASGVQFTFGGPPSLPTMMLQSRNISEFPFR